MKMSGGALLISAGVIMALSAMLGFYFAIEGKPETLAIAGGLITGIIIILTNLDRREK